MVFFQNLHYIKLVLSLVHTTFPQRSLFFTTRKKSLTAHIHLCTASTALTVFFFRATHTVQPARNLHKPSDPGGQNYPCAAEHPLTLVVMTLAYPDDRTRGLAVVACEVSSRSTVFHCLHCTCKL